MRVLALFCVLLCGICPANAASHTLKYFYTAVTAGIDFPEFTDVGLLDDEPFTYYDSNIKRKIPKTEWMKENMGADYWDRDTQKLTGIQQNFKASIGILMQRFNQTQGVHTLQRMYGCEWDNETGATGGFDQYGYDGEDFLTYDMTNQRYIGPTPQAFITVQKWNNDPALLEHRKQYLTLECVAWLRKYVSYGRSTLERTVAPKVSLLQKDSPSPGLTCHVTGFYPRGIMVTWQRNGEELNEDVELGETLPNEDGTFQTRSHLRVKPEDWKSQEYTCTVQHKSLEQDIILPVKVENIKRNRDGSSPLMGIIIGCVLGAQILILAVIGVVIWKKRSSGYRTTNNSDMDSENSDKPAVSVPDYRKTSTSDMDYGISDETAVSVPDYRKTSTSDTDYEISDETAVSVPDYGKTSTSDTDYGISDETAVSVPDYRKTSTLDTDPEISIYCSIDSLDSTTPLLSLRSP